MPMYTHNLTAPLLVWPHAGVNEIAYVNESSAAKALEMEDRFVSLPPIAGVVFASVFAEPAKGGRSTTFKVRLGIRKKMDLGTGIALVKDVLRDEIDNQGLTFQVEVFPGRVGACRDEDFEGARTAQA